MFWNRATSRDAHPARRASIATTLTLYYAAAAVVLLAAASARFYVGLERHIDRHDWESLDERLQALTTRLRREPAAPGVTAAWTEEPGVANRLPSRFLLRILDARGRVLTQSAGMASILPIAAFPPDRADGGSARARLTRRSHAYLLSSQTIGHDADGSPRWRVQAALDVTADRTLLASYSREIAGVLMGGVVLAALIGTGIARRGLRPLAEITRAAEHIEVDRLHRRIGTERWPRELTALAGAFDRMLERLQESFERLSRFSADLAHELRTPINILLGEAQVALSRPRGPEEYVETLQSALEEYARLARMIDRMLFLASADRAQSIIEPRSLDALGELQAVEEFYQALAEDKGVRLACEGRGRVLADPQLLRRALSNLVSNALKNTPRGGRVTLRAAEGARGDTILSVIDTGHGIPAEHLPRLGDRFYRVDRARGDAPGGTGLGLAIVKSIMALHGGSLAIASTPERGTTAELHFPAPSPPDSGPRT